VGLTIKERQLVAQYVITQTHGFYMLCRLGLCLEDHQSLQEVPIAQTPPPPSPASTRGREEAPARG
jgi:hypothetical protein